MVEIRRKTAIMSWFLICAALRIYARLLVDVPLPVLQGFGQVAGLDNAAAVHVGDGAG